MVRYVKDLVKILGFRNASVCQGKSYKNMGSDSFLHGLTFPICDLQYFPRNNSVFPSVATTSLHCLKNPIQKRLNLRIPGGGLPMESTTGK